jgi:hypothetical protein
MHFCEGKAELFPLGENVFMPGKSSVEVEARNAYVVAVHRCFQT